MKRFVGS